MRFLLTTNDQKFLSYFETLFHIIKVRVFMRSYCVNAYRMVVKRCISNLFSFPNISGLLRVYLQNIPTKRRVFQLKNVLVVFSFHQYKA